jgi:GT2 family glycosyltransferase
MNSNRPTVSVIVLSYNRPALLREALAALDAQSYGRVEIILVDNRSPASSEVARIAAEFPAVRLISNDDNLGFTGGMNQGIASASGDYVYLTEDDMTLDRDCILRLIEYAEGRGEEILLSPVLYNRAAGTIRCAGGDVSLGGVFRMKIHGSDEADVGQFARPFDVTYVDGAVIFARTDYMRRLGGFRDDFFMYVDAVELSVRVKKSGGRMTVVPGAKAYHFEPPEGERVPATIQFHKHKNFFALYLLHAPARSLPEFFLRYAVLGAMRSALGRGGDTLPLLRALWWVSRRAPALLGERRRESRVRRARVSRAEAISSGSHAG